MIFLNILFVCFKGMLIWVLKFFGDILKWKFGYYLYNFNIFGTDNGSLLLVCVWEDMWLFNVMNGIFNIFL